MRRKTLTWLSFVFWLFLVGECLWASLVLAARLSPSEDLTQLSLEELMNIEVTSVAKKKQKLSESAAAIFVVTQEDIRRSGVSSIPEALRMVPGLEVARIDGNKWAITSRGFNDRFTNKLLVLIDGRNIYNPLFAGVNWETVDTVLSDIDRIEVIRGPGGTLWGVNAVNGVINIITKSAFETQQGLVVGWGGTEEGIGELRYGGTVGETLSYRIFGKYFNRDTQFNKNGSSDDWRMGRGGFRVDWKADDHNSVMVEGGLYKGAAGQELTVATLTPPFSDTFSEDVDLKGAHVLARWTHEISADSDFSLKFFYDRVERDETIQDYTLDTFDIDFQHRFPFVLGQEITWGGEYRYWLDNFEGSLTIQPSEESRSFNLVSGFIQDEIRLIPEELVVTVGTKLSHNDFTGFEYQPSGRFLWKPRSDLSFWGAASRAVVLPPRLLDDGVITLSTALGPVAVEDNQQAKPEVLHAFELGVRSQPLKQLSFDVTGFFMDYDRLVGNQLQSVPPATTLPTLIRTNNHEAKNYGVEVSTIVQLWEWWKVQGAYTYLKMDIKNEDAAQFSEEASPIHHASIRSQISLPYHIEFDSWLRYTDELPSLNVDDYVELDLRLGWKPMPNLDISLIGQNLLHSHHDEFSDTILGTQRTGMQRSFVGRITWTF